MTFGVFWVMLSHFWVARLCNEYGVSFRRMGSTFIVCYAYMYEYSYKRDIFPVS